jgi:hypothetical protein
MMKAIARNELNPARSGSELRPSRWRESPSFRATGSLQSKRGARLTARTNLYEVAIDLFLDAVLVLCADARGSTGAPCAFDGLRTVDEGLSGQMDRLGPAGSGRRRLA